jgi:hypothetical protein
MANPDIVCVAGRLGGSRRIFEKRGLLHVPSPTNDVLSGDVFFSQMADKEYDIPGQDLFCRHHLVTGVKPPTQHLCHSKNIHRSDSAISCPPERPMILLTQERKHA